MGQNRRYDRKQLSGRVSKQDQELLTRLMEESAELIQICSKTLRWGWNSLHPNGGETNETGIAREITDVADIRNRLMKRRRSFRMRVQEHMVDLDIPPK